MTGAEITRLAREDFLDDAKLEYLWSNDLLETYLNLAEREACRRASLLHDDSTENDSEAVPLPLCSLTVVAGTAIYTVSKKILRILRCVPAATSRSIEKKTEDWLDEFYPAWSDDEGTPVYFLEDKDKIRLVPKPVVDDTMQLSIVRLPLVEMTVGIKSVTGITRVAAVATVNLPSHGYSTGDLITHADADQPEYNITASITKIDGDNYSYPVVGTPATLATGTITAASSESPEIPEEFHMDLIEWICHLAYLKQDAETEDISRSNMYEEKFTQKFGPKLSAITESNRRRKPRNKSLRPKEFGFS